MADQITLPAKLDLPAAAPLLDELQKLEGDIALDGSEINHIGALCLQVLISCAKTAAAAGHSFRVENLSDAAQSQLGFMGVDINNLSESVA